MQGLRIKSICIEHDSKNCNDLYLALFFPSMYVTAVNAYSPHSFYFGESTLPLIENDLVVQVWQYQPFRLIESFCITSTSIFQAIFKRGKQEELIKSLSFFNNKKYNQIQTNSSQYLLNSSLFSPQSKKEMFNKKQYQGIQTNKQSNKFISSWQSQQDKIKKNNYKNNPSNQQEHQNTLSNSQKQFQSLVLFIRGWLLRVAFYQNSISQNLLFQRQKAIPALISVSEKINEKKSTNNIIKNFAKIKNPSSIQNDFFQNIGVEKLSQSIQFEENKFPQGEKKLQYNFLNKKKSIEQFRYPNLYQFENNLKKQKNNQSIIKKQINIKEDIKKTEVYPKEQTKFRQDSQNKLFESLKYFQFKKQRINSVINSCQLNHFKAKYQDQKKVKIGYEFMKQERNSLRKKLLPNYDVVSPFQFQGLKSAKSILLGAKRMQFK